MTTKLRYLPSRTILEAVSSFVFSTTAVLLQVWIERTFSLGTLNSAAISIVCTSVLFYLIHPLIVHFPHSISGIRITVDPRASMEGYWFEIISDSDEKMGRFSIIEIKYFKTADEYLLLGENLTCDNAVYSHHRSFTARKLFLDDSEDRLVYFYRAAQPDNKGLPGVGVVDFVKTGGELYEGATGFFGDNQSHNRMYNFQWIRINEADLFLAIRKKKVKDYQDNVTLASWCTREYAEKIIPGTH